MSIRTILAFCALVFAIPAFGQAKPAPLQPALAEAYVDGVMRQALESTTTSGATVAIVQDGRIVLTKGYGLARVTPRPRPVDADTLFQVASISKTPVYLLAMHLIEAGKLRLDDPANKYLAPSLQIPGQGFGQPVTIRHLMTHSAGFEDTALGHLFVGSVDRLQPLDAYLAGYRPVRARRPGVQLSYSNYALGLLGHIVARVYGADWPTVAEHELLRPLGMARSTYRDPYGADVAARLHLPTPMPADVAENITQQLTGGPGAWRERQREYVTNLAPAGGLHASANDMAQYLLALTDPARLEAVGIVKQATFADMLQPGIALPYAPRHGFLNYRMPGGREAFGHGGAMGFGASDLVVVPDLKLGIFVSTNGRGGFAFANDFARRFVAEFYPGDESPVVRGPEVGSAAQAVAGGWIANRRSTARSERFLLAANSFFSLIAKPDGDLVREAFDGSKSLLQPVGNNVWRNVKTLTLVRFAKDADGHDTLWTSSGSGSAQRAGLLDRPIVTLGVLALGLVVALRLLIALTRRARGLDGAGWATLAAALAWVVALGGLSVFIASIMDEDAGAGLLYSYPGSYAVWCWLIALAAVLTLVAFALSLRAKASRVRIVQLAGLLVLSMFAWQQGLLGYSGF